MRINSRLKSIREGKNITLGYLAERLEWPISKLSKIENDSQDITFKELEALCENLGVSVQDVVGEKRFIGLSHEGNYYNAAEKFKEVIRNYGSVTRDNFAGNQLIKVITKELPDAIGNSIDIDLERFYIKGSGGNGQPAEVPWISIFLRDITTTATKGLYLVFLIKADLTGMYLSLNQGFTYFKDKYGTKDGKLKIRKAAKEVRNILNTLPDDSLFDIDLKCVNSLGKGYEAGNIAAKYYSLDNLSSDVEIINDIRNYITAYEELRGIIGFRTVDQFYDFLLLKEDGYDISDEEEIDAVNEALASYEVHKECSAEFKGEKKEKKDSILDNKGKKVFPRDAKVAANALEIAGYKCEIDENHVSFTRRANGENYTESHHLIPLSYQDDFEYGLDVEENIVSLCSNCHNCIHYGVDEERVSLLDMLYEERKEHLDRVGLKISLEDLKNYYGIDEML
jgi:5-methylcytosine-specific restriction protein A